MFKCDVCDKEFEEELQLRGHMMAHKRSVKDEVRKERVPFGVQLPKLSAEKIEGKSQRWINDDNDRINRAKQGSYTHVNDESGNPKSKIVGKKTDGSPLTAYLMQIDQDLYDEDQIAKQETRERLSRQIHDPNYENTADDKRYVPQTHPRSIRIST